MDKIKILYWTVQVLLSQNLVADIYIEVPLGTHGAVQLQCLPWQWKRTHRDDTSNQRLVSVRHSGSKGYDTSDGTLNKIIFILINDFLPCCLFFYVSLTTVDGSQVYRS